MHPIIGIVACARDRGRQFVSEAYIQAVEMAGGVPVLIPCTGDSSHFPRYYSMCDGFLFCGGDDISPRLFGEDLLTEEGRTDEETDLFHLAFMKYALSTSLPVLAICRGMQVMNITRRQYLAGYFSQRRDVPKSYAAVREAQRRLPPDFLLTK